MDFLTPSQVAKHLSIGKNRVYALIKSGEIPAIKIGTRYKIPKNQLMEWIENNLLESHEPDKKSA